MALMLAKTYAAFKAAGVADAEAQAAAEEIAGYENRLVSIDGKVAAVESNVRLLTWMVGGIYLIGVPSLWLLLRMAAKVGALG
jgi:hypothetical protein